MLAQPARTREVLAYLGFGLAFYLLAAAHHFATRPFAWARLQAWLSGLLGS